MAPEGHLMGSLSGMPLGRTGRGLGCARLPWEHKALASQQGAAEGPLQGGAASATVVSRLVDSGRFVVAWI